MPDEMMPAIEVQEDESADEAVAYECAFHILPTIADEEVSGVVQRLKDGITRLGGAVTDEEVSERYNLAYEIVSHREGSNRRFNAAHFGWVRFTLTPSALFTYRDELMHMPELLRFLATRLTPQEQAQPFSIFETHRAQARINAERATSAREARGEVEGEVSEELLDQELEKITVE